MNTITKQNPAREALTRAVNKAIAEGGPRFVNLPTSAAHTPGPWMPSENGPSIRVFAEPDSGGVCGICDIYRYHGTKLQSWANARLIASAPELLAALKALRADLGAAGPFVLGSIRSNLAIQADAAVAAAEGRSQAEGRT